MVAFLEARRAEDGVQLHRDLGHQLGHQPRAVALFVARVQQPAAVDQGAALDQVDEPQLVQAIGQVRLELQTAIEAARRVADLDRELYLLDRRLQGRARLGDRDVRFGLAVAAG